MCGRFAQYAPIVLSDAAELMLGEHDAEAATVNQREPRYNLAPIMHAALMARNANQRLTVQGLR